MDNKNELLVSIIKKSLKSFNLELISFSEKDARFVNKNYSIGYKIIKEENHYRLFWEFYSEIQLSITEIEEFNFKFDKEIEEIKFKIKSIEMILDNIKKFKSFINKVFKSIYKEE